MEGLITFDSVLIHHITCLSSLLSLALWEFRHAHSSDPEDVAEGEDSDKEDEPQMDNFATILLKSPNAEDRNIFICDVIMYAVIVTRFIIEFRYVTLGQHFVVLKILNLVRPCSTQVAFPGKITCSFIYEREVLKESKLSYRLISCFS